MKNIVLFFGGVSCEHDISVLTGIQTLAAVEKAYNVYPVYIHTDGIWFTGNALKNINAYSDFETIKNSLKRVCIIPYSRFLYSHKKNKLLPLCEIDAAVVAMHGLNGEDGSLAGLLQLAGIPQTSSSVLGAALGMDKIAMKIFFQGLGLNVLPYVYINRREYMFESLSALIKIEKAIGYPLIVKPSMLGSSIGISVCRNRSELTGAIETAIRFDRRLLIEKAVSGFTEINCAALKTGGKIKTTECEKPLNWTDFLSFNDKYMQDIKGMSGSKREFPADIPKDVSDRIKEIVKLIYGSLNLKGVIRADFIVTDEIYINEINTVPGSLSYYLWENEGINFKKLTDIMIAEACEDMRDFNKCSFSFRSDVLKQGKAGGKKKP